MAVNFPNSPSVNQRFTSPSSSVALTWNGTSWASSPVTASFVVSASNIVPTASLVASASLALTASNVPFYFSTASSFGTSVNFGSFNFRVPSTGNKSIQIQKTNGTSSIGGVVEAVYLNSSNPIVVWLNRNTFAVSGGFAYFVPATNFTRNGDVQRITFFETASLTTPTAYEVTCMLDLTNTRSYWSINRLI